MSYLSWRLYRVPGAITLALLAAFAVLMVITGVQVAHQWHSVLAGCAASHSCGTLPDTVFLGNHAVGFLVIMTLGIPAVLGILLGAPLVASEAEAGTSIFAWTQGITRRHWLTVKAGWLLLASAVVSAAVSALVTWWSGPNNALQADGFNPGRFDIMGIVPVGYAVFAVALGITAGALLRRVIPAIAITILGFIAVRVVIFTWARQHYMGAVTHAFGLTQSFTPAGAAWQIASGVRTPSGRLLPMTGGSDIAQNVSASTVPASCHAQSNSAILSCMQSAGFRQFITYQPADRYWIFQGIETAIFVALAAALLAVALYVIRRRDA